MRFDDYDARRSYDETFDESNRPRPHCARLIEALEGITPEEYDRQRRSAEKLLFDLGVTFQVYGETQGVERIFPVDMVPRVISAREWDVIDRGLLQRVTALNLFIEDVYNDRRILSEGVVPEHLVLGAPGYRAQCEGFRPPHGVWAHVVGSDLVRHSDGTVYVLEDNLRCPSGVSYVLENRAVMKRTFPGLFAGMGIRPVSGYPDVLLNALASVKPKGVEHPRVAVWTPGRYNSAYFEHAFLAQEMGVELVEGADLAIVDGRLAMRTTSGPSPIDVLYRRLDDDFIDPNAFNPESMLGVPGLFEVAQAGRLTLANAPGTGVADDKVIFKFVPDMIRFYLDQDPILPNVPTHLCDDPKELRYVLEHLPELVAKPANASGGYGVTVGPHSTEAQIERCREAILANPREWIAQPTLNLSTAPTLIGESFRARHVDLRPFVVTGKHGPEVIPGGLTRVALKEGSLVVNSSQGGGSKDTWVVSQDR